METIKPVSSFENGYDDEIDLIELIKIQWKYRYLLFACVFLGIISAFLYNHFAKKEYHIEATFFLPSVENDLPNSISGYTKLLGISKPSNLDGYVQNLLESRRIRLEVSRYFLEVFSKNINNAIQKNLLKNTPEDICDFVMNSCLNLKKKIATSVNKKSLFRLEYYYTDPSIAYEVVQLYLSTLLELNKELRITGEKDFIRILDPPRLPDKRYPVKPKKVMNILIGLLGGGMTGMGLTFIFSALSSRKKQI